MNFVVHIRYIEKGSYRYDNSFQVRLQKEVPEVDFIDLDNDSDALLIQTTLDILKKTSKACICFDLHPDADMRSYISFATYLLDYPEKIIVFVTGENSIISKLIPTNQPFIYHNKSEDEQLSIMKGFF